MPVDAVGVATLVGVLVVAAACLANNGLPTNASRPTPAAPSAPRVITSASPG